LIEIKNENVSISNNSVSKKLDVKKNTVCSVSGNMVEGKIKTLSIRLREMEDYGLIKRKVTQKRPLQVEYTLTEKGNALNSILVHIAEFSAIYEPEKIFKDKKPKYMSQLFGTEFLSEVYD